MDILKQPETGNGLDGVVFGPQSRLSLEEFRSAVPQRYPVRFYPENTHSVSRQYPVPAWDGAYVRCKYKKINNLSMAERQGFEFVHTKRVTGIISKNTPELYP